MFMSFSKTESVPFQTKTIPSNTKSLSTGPTINEHVT